MGKKIGLIQTGGIGDIIIAIPIADAFTQQGYDVYWPISDRLIDTFRYAKPRINFIPVTEGRGHLLEKPQQMLKEIDCEEFIILYSYLTHAEVYNKSLSRSLKFDEYKYAISGIPFAHKWNLTLNRDMQREHALYQKLNITKPYICLHTKGSEVDIKVPIPKNWLNDYQLVEVDDITDNPFDWIYTIENASKLILIDSCFSNLVEQLNLKNEKYLILRSDIPFTPVLKNGWGFITSDLHQA